MNMKTNTKENMRENGIQSVKVVILGILLSVGIAYAWTGPTQSPPNGNAPAPINVGSLTQEKDGGLIFGKLFTGSSTDATLNVYKNPTTGGVIWGGALGLTGDANVGRDVIVGKLSADANQGLDVTDFPAHVCADVDGKLVLCGAPVVVVTPGAPTITFTINGTSSVSINEQANLTVAASHPVTLAWSVSGASSCTASAKLLNSGADVSSATGWTGSKNAAGGTLGATVNNFSTTQYQLTCDGDGSASTTTDQASATVTAKLSGSMLDTSPGTGTFTVPANVISLKTIEVWGGGGAGGDGSTGAGGGGGASGAYGSFGPNAVIPGQSISLTVGAGGFIFGTPGSNGGGGNVTSFFGVSAPGGNGGESALNGSSGGTLCNATGTYATCLSGNNGGTSTGGLGGGKLHPGPYGHGGDGGSASLNSKGSVGIDGAVSITW